MRSDSPDNYWLEVWESDGERAWQKPDEYETAVVCSTPHERGPYRTRNEADEALDRVESEPWAVEVMLRRNQHEYLGTYRRNRDGALVHAQSEEAL